MIQRIFLILIKEDQRFSSNAIFLSKEIFWRCDLCWYNRPGKGQQLGLPRSVWITVPYRTVYVTIYVTSSVITQDLTYYRCGIFCTLVFFIIWNFKYGLLSCDSVCTSFICMQYSYYDGFRIDLNKVSREKQNLLSAILKINRLDTSKKDKLIKTNLLLLKIKKLCVLSRPYRIFQWCVWGCK